MNSAEHKAEAERMLKEAQTQRAGSYEEQYFLGAAQVHATLATIKDDRVVNTGPL